MSLGIALSILSALLFAGSDVAKKVLSASTPMFVVIWIPVTWGVLVGGSYFLIQGIPSFDSAVVFPLAIMSALILVLIEVLFMRVISRAEISLVVPLLSFAPITAGAFAWLVSGEVPAAGAYLGIALIVIASWLMYAEPRDRRALLRPLVRLLSDPNARLMLLLCLVDGIFVNLMHAGGKAAPPSFFVWLVLVFEWLVLTTTMVVRRITPHTAIIRTPTLVFATGFLWTAGMVAFFESLAHTIVAYSMAANRTHALFVVILGAYTFGEHELRKRLAAAALMVCGVAILIVSDA